MIRIKRAQSILEYIIVLSAVTTAVIAATKDGGHIKNAINKMFQDASTLIEDKTSEFLANAAGGTSPRRTPKY